MFLAVVMQLVRNSIINFEKIIQSLLYINDIFFKFLKDAFRLHMLSSSANKKTQKGLNKNKELQY